MWACGDRCTGRDGPSQVRADGWTGGPLRPRGPRARSCLLALRLILRARATGPVAVAPRDLERRVGNLVVVARGALLVAFDRFLSLSHRARPAGHPGRTGRAYPP